jgi:hypothetical protein
LKVSEVKPLYKRRLSTLNGFEILNHYFDAALSRDPRLFAFGEDLGKIGDVNRALPAAGKAW